MRIRLESVSVEFGSGLPGAHLALADVSLSVGTDECVAVVGPTGAGKTTLLEVAAGLLAPSSGRAALEGSQGHKLLRSAAGLVYQFPELQFFEETVYDDVAFGPKRMGLVGDELDGCVTGALRRAGLDPAAFSDRSPVTLSAGEKRRAAIAGILALDRPFLLLDEPTAGLDPSARDGIISLLAGEADERGIVLVTHDLDMVDRIAGRTVVMHAGRKEIDGRTRSVLSDVERLERLGLTPPARHVLVAALQKRAPEEARRVSDILFRGPLADHDSG